MQISIAVLLILALQGATGENDPCRCARSKSSVERAFRRADVVFVGKAVSLDYAAELENPRRRVGPHVQKVTFQVTHIFKGGNALEREVYVDLRLNCSFQFVVPDTYIVYAWHEHRMNGLLTTTRCARTDLIAGAGEDMRKLPQLRTQDGDKKP